MKTMKTRISLKYDSYTAWQNSDLKLRPGEIALAYIEENDQNIPEGVSTNSVLYKCGMGDPNDTSTWKKFSQLPWGSALAADIDGWAKQSENDFVNTFLTLKMSDNTTMRDKLDSVFATDDALQEAVEALQSAIDDIIAAAISVKDIENNPVSVAHEEGSAVYTVSHDTIAAPVGTSGSGRTYLTGVSTDGYGHITGFTTATEEDQDLENTITNAINKLDATANHSAGSDGLALNVTQEDGKITSISGSIAANTYDAHGAAATVKSEVIGVSGDTATADTIYGAKAAAKAAKDAADAAQADIDAFFSAADTGTEALDTLKEIQDFLESDDGTVQTLLDNVDNLKNNKADKVTGAINGNFAGLDANGNLTDSGKKAADFEVAGAAAAAQAAAEDKAQQLVNDINNTIDHIIYDETGNPEYPDGWEVIPVRQAYYANYADEAYKASNDENGNQIHTTYATKEEVATLTTDDIAAGEEVWIFDCGGAGAGTVTMGTIMMSSSGASYEFEVGMTWAEFVESDYNTDGIFSINAYDEIDYRGQPVCSDIDGTICPESGDVIVEGLYY